MTNKVKPFYIRITDDMTPQMVQDAFDKCVDAGAVACDFVYGERLGFKYSHGYDFGCYPLFGVCDRNETKFYSTGEWFSIDAQEITLDQLDKWLGLELEQEWKNGDACIYTGQPDIKCKFVSVHPNNNKCAIVWEGGGDCNLSCVAIDYLSKPETPEQKAERERQHAVYDMCNDLDNHTDDARFWCEKLYDAGYRKQ